MELKSTTDRQPLKPTEASLDSSESRKCTSEEKRFTKSRSVKPVFPYALPKGTGLK